MKVLNLDVKSGELISGESIQQVKMIMMDRLITCLFADIVFILIVNNRLFYKKIVIPKFIFIYFTK